MNEDDEISFELIGFDFMIDSDLKVFLIEVNKNPCLSTLSQPQTVLITKLLRDTFTLVLDPFSNTHMKDAKATIDVSRPLTDFELVHVHTAF
jgi:Tubulin-tyrosine ligase family